LAPCPHSPCSLPFDSREASTSGARGWTSLYAGALRTTCDDPPAIVCAHCQRVTMHPTSPRLRRVIPPSQ
ncbi:unnamed protein product, partial [Ectocarpus sp. 8 AP-2014]